MYELALFAGAGGGILGGHLLGWQTVAAVEIDDYCRKVLLQRQRDGILPPFPLWDDVCTFDGRKWNGLVDVLSAGFPCQPFSTAASNRRKGNKDSRNMWPETIRIIREIKPKWLLLENVTGLTSFRDSSGQYYFNQILLEISEAGYNCRWGCLSAAQLGARHKRNRIWIIAHDNSTRCKKQRWPISAPKEHKTIERSFKWPSEPGMGRVVSGMAHRVDRLRALGNGQVPIVAAAAFRLLAADLII